VVFGSSATLGKAIEFHSDLKEPMSKFGRQTDDLKVASGISVVIGESKQEARDKLESWQDLIHPDVGVMRLGQDLEADLSDLPIWNGGPYLAVLATTFSVAFSTTALCLVLGYPLAYWLCRKPPRQQRIATLFVLLPFWTSALIKNFSWLVCSGETASSPRPWHGWARPAATGCCSAARLSCSR
jgi:ABC-type sugar transport system permease subunit